MTPNVWNAETWGARLRQYRETLELSQDRLADQIMLLCAQMSQDDAERFARLRLECPEALAGYEVSRFENGKRLPMRRSMHLLLVWVLIESGAALSIGEINDWLELGFQGWLTDREREALFG
jgi:transcriptional regulator with XRE-family HTH domain